MSAADQIRKFVNLLAAIFFASIFDVFAKFIIFFKPPRANSLRLQI